jgi:hypothetical protein
VADAVRKIGVTEFTYYYLWTALPLQGDFDPICVVCCKHLSGVPGNSGESWLGLFEQFRGSR